MKLTVHTTKETAELNDLFGIFFEDINHAADGGLYAELVQNRSFEFCQTDHPTYHGLTAWEAVENDGTAVLSIGCGDAVSEKNPHFLQIEVCTPGSDVGVLNTGFYPGIPLMAGAEYDFSCYARCVEGDCTKVTVSLRSVEGTIYTLKEFAVTSEWKKYEYSLVSPAEDTSARLALTVQGKGKMQFDFVSLFPKDTYKGRKNGLRKDLAETLAAMHPKFLRFPGGCLVHDGSLDAADRDAQYRWKNSIGPLEERPARRNNWGYNQTLGLGFYEYFQLCEDIGAKPVPVLPGGYDPHHHREAHGEQLAEFIQDALDLIEFANGPADSEWGSRRAKMGHPEPFALEYIAIGNEEIGEPFFERFPLFYRAIKEQYPQIKVIGTSGPFAAGTEYERGFRSAREDGADLVDEHYYQSPEWLIANHHRYASFEENGPKIFLGEYASQDNTWYNALAEASYMIGLQNNARVVSLACYAPLFCHVDYTNWKPDLLWFDNHRLMRTPNYYVQKLFMEHQGEVLLAQELTEEGAGQKAVREADLSGEISLGTDESRTHFFDITVTEEDTGSVNRIEGLTIEPEGTDVRIASVTGSHYTICLKAEELEGKKGFLINFAGKGTGNRLFWRLGGWANEDSMIGQDTNGKNAVLTQTVRSINRNRVYDLRIEVKGSLITTFVDGRKELETRVLPVNPEPVYATASKDRATGDILIKLVNLRKEAKRLEICLTGNGVFAGTAYKMEGFLPEARNVLGEAEAVAPQEEVVFFPSGTFFWELKPESFYVLRLREKPEGQIIPGLFADPYLIKYKDTYYLYPTTDGVSGWAGTKFHAFSSPDLKNWRDEGVILDVAGEQVPWAIGSAWAPTMYERNGIFYFYFCAKRADGVSCIGVATSASPTGGFCAEPKPLITPELLQKEGVTMSQTIDPSVYEEDGAVYLLFGNGKPAIVRLSDDLRRIEPGTMKNLEGAYDFREAIDVSKRDGRYHFTWSCDDTGSEEYHVNYGTAESLYGPICYHYPVLKKCPEKDMLGTGHHCTLKEPGKETCYMAYHRFATPTGNYPEEKGCHREVCLAKVTFSDTGLMQEVEL